MSDLNSELELIDSARQLPEPVNARISQYRHLEKHMHNDLGIYKNIRIEGYESKGGEGKLMRLVHHDEIKRRMEVDEQAIQLFQRYASYDIAFLCVLGEKGNGKSFILDKLLNLAGVTGNHLSVNRDDGLFIWSQPFCKRNLRVFLLDCRGFNSQSLSTVDAKLTSLLMLLCSTVLFNNRTKTESNDFKAFQSLVHNTYSNATINGKKLQKEDGVMPNSLYHLYRTRSLATSSEMTHYFPNYDFTFLEDAMVANYKGKDYDLVECSFLTTNCISEKYVRHLGEIFSMVLNNIQEKTICGVTFNGNIIGKVLRNAVQILNRDDVLDISKLFKSVIAELYVSAYNFCVISYSDALEKELRDEAPKSLNDLLRIFGTASDETMTKYHEFNLDPELHRQYLTKLQEHIDMKEQLLLEINLKKTQNLLRGKFKGQPPKSIDAAINNAEMLAKFNPELDHGREVVAAEMLGQWLEGASQNLGNYQLQLQYESKQEQLSKLSRQVSEAQQRNSLLQTELAKEEQRTEGQRQLERKQSVALDAEVKKLQAANRERVSVPSSNIDELRNQYEATVRQNQRKIGNLNSQLASLASNLNSPPKQQPSKVARPEVSAQRKEFSMLTEKDKNFQRILPLQEEEIRSLNNDIAALSKKK